MREASPKPAPEPETHDSWIGVSLPRKDGAAKVQGATLFTDDKPIPGLLYAALVTSPHAHATIASVDDAEARQTSGVRGVFCGDDFPFRVGLYLGDKPPLAIGRRVKKEKPFSGPTIGP